MNIVLLMTGRGTTRATMADFERQLGVRPDDMVTLIGRQAPAEPLAVTQHLLVPSALHAIQELPVVARVEASSQEGHPTVTPASAAAAPAAGSSPTPGPAAGSTSLALPLKVAKVARTFSVRAGRRVRGRLLARGANYQFAVAASVAPPVSAAVSDCDVLVALDVGSQFAGWLIARRHPGPAAVAGLLAGKLAIERARSMVL